MSSIRGSCASVVDIGCCVYSMIGIVCTFTPVVGGHSSLCATLPYDVSYLSNCTTLFSLRVVTELEEDHSKNNNDDEYCNKPQQLGMYSLHLDHHLWFFYQSYGSAVLDYSSMWVPKEWFANVLFSLYFECMELVRSKISATTQWSL